MVRDYLRMEIGTLDNSEALEPWPLYEEMHSFLSNKELNMFFPSDILHYIVGATVDFFNKQETL